MMNQSSDESERKRVTIDNLVSKKIMINPNFNVNKEK